tara:strand:+ start:494 stop:898 length:405 start_codon:yes stop_codon:yes gene_type:complete
MSSYKFKFKNDNRLQDRRSSKLHGMTNTEFIATFLHRNPGSRWSDIKKAIYSWRYGKPHNKCSDLNQWEWYLTKRPIYTQASQYNGWQETPYVGYLWVKHLDHEARPRYFITLEGMNWVKDKITPHWKNSQGEQ